MAYVALYRRWRPQDFDTLVGQHAVKTALSNALASGRIAHAYLFTGPRGTGKTSTARILAKALNCDKGPTAHPCGECLNCERIAAGASMDVIEIDAASNRGIDEIKSLRDQTAYSPVNGRYKVFIIDEVH
ncbi:MAG: AAA family ATPase, partial [Phascolarctobacterium sp.]|nr:AAA family ATPase [Phascolarctobacterium sp.]